MAPLPGKKSIVALCLGLFLLLTLAYAQQQQGRIIDRNGAPQAGCQIAFSAGPNQPPLYRATSNNDGSFYVANPRPGPYYVTVHHGQQVFAVQVVVTPNGLQPATLVATW